jgi:hypothetical protein
MTLGILARCSASTHKGRSLVQDSGSSGEAADGELWDERFNALFAHLPEHLRS